MVSFSRFADSDEAKAPHYMVVGQPIGHSLSPLMHNAALQYHGMDAVYHAVELSPDDLPSFASFMNRDTFLGCNITIPYKREFLDWVDRLDETARAVGAMNTLVRESDGWVGYNTDVDGFRDPLMSRHDEIAGERAIVFGTGGASLAVRHALAQLDVEEIIQVSRTPGSIQPEGVTICGYNNWTAYAEEAVLLVNTTPLGMAPMENQSPVREQEQAFLDGRICYDLIYNPRETLFLRQAREAGAEIIDGLGMFIGQGDHAFQLWTGKSFPTQRIRELVEEHLRNRI
ncbi:MAG: shikimate dehydrogenase [Balneolaceae bacterium]